MFLMLPQRRETIIWAPLKLHVMKLLCEERHKEDVCASLTECFTSAF